MSKHFIAQKNIGLYKKLFKKEEAIDRYSTSPIAPPSYVLSTPFFPFILCAFLFIPPLSWISPTHPHPHPHPHPPGYASIKAINRVWLWF